MRIMKNTLWKGTSFTIPKSSSSKGCSLIAFIIMIWMLNSVPAHAFESLTIQNIEAMQRTDEGLKELIHRFEQDQERIKADRPDIYFYLKGLYSVVHNDFESAQEYYGKSKELSKITNHTDVEIAVLKRQIELSDFYGDSGELIDYGSRLLELAELNQDKITEMYAYDTIALAYYYLTNDEKANEYLEKLILLATKNKNEEYKAIYYTIMGHIYYSYQEYEKALKYYGPAMTAYQSVEQNSNMVFNMQFLAEGNILSTKAKFALEESEKAAILKEINVLIEKANDLYISKPTLYFLYVFKGQIEQDFHMIEEAIASYYFSREILETIQHIEKPYSYLNYVEMFLASAYYEHGDYQEAADIFVRIIERDKNPELLKSWDEASSKLREFSEKELTGKIDLLFELQNAQNKKIEYQRISLYLSTLVILLLIGAITWKIHENKKINQLKNQLYHQSITDGLTGVFNREKIFEILDKEVKKDSVIALVDIDNFKSINDTLGYLVGDDVLKRVVDTIKMSIREQDEIGRYGGEEFIIIIKDTTLEDAVKIIERIRKNVEALEWEYDQLKTTISAGVCKKSALAVEEVFKEVDELVHEAKRTGKNKVVYKICF